MQLPTQLTLGVATAAYQIEGAVDEDGRGRSIWDVYSHTPGRIKDGTNADLALDHYHRLEADLDLIQELGVQAYRFSIAWPRVVPGGIGVVNQAGIDFYSRLVDGLLARGIEPMATLYHWDLPQPLEESGGWPARETAVAFGEYAATIGTALGDRVNTWTTFNEPWGSAYLGYASGAHAPGRQNAADAFRAVHHLNLAHGLGVRALRDVVRADAVLSTTLNLHTFRPAGPTGEEARDRLEAIANEAFLAPMFDGRLSKRLVELTQSITDWGFVDDGDLAEISRPIDALGINYYYTNSVRMRSPGDTTSPGLQWPAAEGVEILPKQGPLTEMGWNIDPAGLTELLLALHLRTDGLPLMITENGAAFPDAVDGDERVRDVDRIDYLREHLEAATVAIEAGVDVRAFIVWTLIDNFEWSLGFAKRFGLYRVETGSLRRIPKDSAVWFRDVIAARDTAVPAPA
ncbi:GH1 family beta-glucosidase [Agromyces kandeliae]|uniref:Beta-glucosidase n=1 Tax=Agromyces kandeliae TaxID=2666141 RepID=A0A6L5R5G5_9MICO|nr:GH1 family beta-glucosidase [Agromyces kandeliae]MRX45242.1 beta-glucosidase [Agromyces kandeliae]